MSIVARPARTTVFTPRLQALLQMHRGQDVFRLEQGTMGVAGLGLSDQILAARPATEFERPTFKPLHGRSIPRADAIRLMQAVGKDVRAALKKPLPATTDFAGKWPHVGHVFLRDLLLGHDPYRLRLLMDRALELTPTLTWAVIGTGASIRFSLGEAASEVARLTAQATGYHGRRYAMGLYRRTVAPVCFTISTLVANAVWLGAPFDPQTPNAHILYEALRLLPPSWNILRRASPEYPPIDRRIGRQDDILVLPLLSQRDPAVWDEPDRFAPERWAGLDPDNLPGYLPFGHRAERCWGRHMVMPLAEMLLDKIRRDGLQVASTQTRAQVPLAGLLGVAEVKLAHPRGH